MTHFSVSFQAYDDAEHRITEQTCQQLLDEKSEVLNRTLQSSNSAVQALLETERVNTVPDHDADL